LRGGSESGRPLDSPLQPRNSPQECAELVDVGPEKLKFAMLNFYRDVDAYDGDPPQP
jgi:hypothetical protein